MIYEYEKFQLPDQNKRNDLFAEVNWKKDDSVYPCKVVKFKLGDKTSYIPTKYLFGMLWAIGTRKQQMKSVPMSEQKVRHYETVIEIKAWKDIKKGEKVRGRISLSLPSITDEVIADVSKKLDIPKKAIKKSPGGILIPKGKVEENKK